MTLELSYAVSADAVVGSDPAREVSATIGGIDVGPFAEGGALTFDIVERVRD